MAIRTFRTLKETIGRTPIWRWREDAVDVNWLHRVNENIILILGVSRREDDTVPGDRWVEDMTRPFVVYRDERSRSTFFWMKMDLENPNEPQGGNLTAIEAISAVKEEIWRTNATTYPVVNPTAIPGRSTDGSQEAAT